MMYRLMKATHEYGAGTATFYMTSSKSLEVVMDLLADHARRLRKIGCRRPA
jgi:adenylylsulfate reductase subunit A